MYGENRQKTYKGDGLTEFAVLLAFAATLAVCVVLGLPLLLALMLGYVLFFCYGLLKKHSAAALVRMSLAGIRKAKNILILFLMIGLLTALWRTGGTIPAIVCWAAGLVQPSGMVLMAFLLNCLVSFLTGTAFGTAATMGVICMTMASYMHVDPVIAGGAILSGVFFGDRCSPVSTSALLVAELTGTDIFQNIRLMIKSSLVPFLVTCAVYLALGLAAGGGTSSADTVRPLFAAQFRLGFIPLIPALLILALSLFRVSVKKAMLGSILAALAVSVFYQKMPLREVASAMVFGYRAPGAELAAMIDGGGLVSMLRVAAIVCLSSSYSGIFEGTGLLAPLKAQVGKLSRAVSPFGSMLIVSAAAAMVACNQTLAIMLTHQICAAEGADPRQTAIDLENTAVVVAPLVPWSIAAAVPLASVGAPMTGILAACYLYLIPLWNLLVRRRRKT